ncbi:serine/arginine-rich SC35-like splicing factor SCL33 isoform X2 [Dioscorea cayenensis subsp. rotundata]|uniref:Serine/arginine-rich SC35-like splicing factor SCL33 isoform X2 n=1 Tax=Dioscorea cayennensis subsp. rotundata TaxID=55577 RepID=A0AB40CLC0_DIOCR|nr:serine/arginine-rich SC35-like splicing factor SCL33 isoform X2 [Dioscorea cayenensis subsp. rotundata]
MRVRSYSYSPSPPRGYRRRGRSPSPRGRYGGRGRDLPCSLLVRNLRHDCRTDDLRKSFGQFGPLKDIYLPRDYYTGEPRGFGFVQFVDPADASEAKYQMDRQILLGRELTVVFAEENRKKPADMRARERLRTYGRESRRSPRYSRSPSPRYSRSPVRRYTRSPPPAPVRRYTRSPPPAPVRRYTRSPPRYSRSPPPQRHFGRSRSRSPGVYSPLPVPQDRSRYSSFSRRSVSPQAVRQQRERSYSQSPYNGSRSRSPADDNYERKQSHREGSLSA